MGKKKNKGQKQQPAGDAGSSGSGQQPQQPPQQQQQQQAQAPQQQAQRPQQPQQQGQRPQQPQQPPQQQQQQAQAPQQQAQRPQQPQQPGQRPQQQQQQQQQGQRPQQPQQQPGPRQPTPGAVSQQHPPQPAGVWGQRLQQPQQQQTRPQQPQQQQGPRHPPPGIYAQQQRPQQPQQQQMRPQQPQQQQAPRQYPPGAYAQQQQPQQQQTRPQQPQQQQQAPAGAWGQQQRPQQQQQSAPAPQHEQQWQGGRGDGQGERGRGRGDGRGGRGGRGGERGRGFEGRGDGQGRGQTSYQQDSPSRGGGGGGRGQGRGARSDYRRDSESDARSTTSETRSVASEPRSVASEPRSVASEPKSSASDVKSSVSDQARQSSPDQFEIKTVAPGGGKTGKSIQVFANHFPITIGKVKTVYHYDIDIQPDRPKKMFKDVFKICKATYFPKINAAFDGRKNIMSPKVLFAGDAVTGKVNVPDDNDRTKEFEVKIQQVNIINLGDVDTYMRSTEAGRNSKQPAEAILALNIVLRHTLLMNRINVGSSFFTTPRDNEMINLGNGMQMYRGFFQSFTVGWKPYLNVDVANKAFPISQNIIELIKEVCFRSDPRQPLDDRNIVTLEKFLRNLKVEFVLPNKPSSKKKYRVNGVKGPSNREMFDLNGRQVSVANYFSNEKNYRLQYPDMPCLWVGSLNSKVYVPCELCKILPDQAVPRKLDANQTRNMIRECATSTDIRKDSINDAIQRADYNRDPVINDFDINVSPNMVKLGARVLDPPNLGYKNQVVHVARGVWNPSSFYNGATMRGWTILNLDDRTRNEDVEFFAQQIVRNAPQLGMVIPGPSKPFVSLRFNPRGFRQTLAEQFSKFITRVDLIFVIIPERDEVYNRVKQAAELSVGCMTQCIKSKTVYNIVRKGGDPSTIKNILLKVNAKLNGLNHVINNPPAILAETMLMGADVTHPSPDSRDIPSFAAVTASHDPQAFKYNICWRIQSPKLEIIQDLESITREQITYYYKMTNTLPRRIIFYRDGVSEGQFKIVLNSELQAIRRACSRIKMEYKPQITFIVVQKRHHTRLFPADKKDCYDKRNFNVPAGTCVDTEIVYRNWQNFFLVSHASIQGVAKPTKYVTLWDDKGFSNDELQSLTYYLCHMFARCTRSVSYPAPTYYAHLAAARAKVYCETERINMDRLTDMFNSMQIKESIVKGLPMFFV